MTSRLVSIVLIAVIVGFPHTASAQTANTRLVFETKKLTALPIIMEADPVKIDADEQGRVYMSESSIRSYVCPRMGKQCDVFIAILKAENGTHECTRDNRGLNRNGSVDVGLAQINWNKHYNLPYTIDQLRDCKFNLDIALKKYETRGFQPWVAYNKGTYKKFLKTASAVN